MKHNKQRSDIDSTKARALEIIVLRKVMEVGSDGITLTNLIRSEDVQYHRANFHSNDIRDTSFRATVRRTCESLENRGILDIDDTSKEHLYRLRDSKEAKEKMLLMMNPQIEPEMIESLLLASSLFDYFENTDLKKGLDNLKEFCFKLKNIAGETHDNSSPFQIKTRGTYDYQNNHVNNHLDALISACTSRSLVTITYESPWHGIQKLQKLEPHRLILFDNTFYLLAFNPEVGKGFRIYNLLRVRSVTDGKENFTPRDTSEFDQQLSDCFGIFIHGNKQDVAIRFSTDNGDSNTLAIVSSRQWHHSSHFDEQTNTLTMSVLVNEELASWIRSWGKAVVSVEPKELADMVQDN